MSKCENEQMGQLLQNVILLPKFLLSMLSQYQKQTDLLVRIAPNKAAIPNRQMDK